MKSQNSKPRVKLQKTSRKINTIKRDEKLTCKYKSLTIRGSRNYLLTIVPKSMANIQRTKNNK